MRLLHFSMLALIALASLPATSAGASGDPGPQGEVGPQETATCATSETGFVDGRPCLGFGGRIWGNCDGCGVESGSLIGPIDADANVADGSLSLDKIAAALVPVTVVASPVRDGRVIELGIADPPRRSLLLFRTPATHPDDHSQEVRIRTAGTGDIVFVWRSLTNAGGAPIRWRDLGNNQWHLAVFDSGWFLLDWR